MASTVNVGTLQGVLAMRDEFSAQLQKFETRIKAAEAKIQGFSRTQKSEADKVRDAYNKVAASLDPVVARTQRYEKQVEALNRALKAGIITQSQYNSQLAKAQLQLQATTHWTQRLGASIGSELTGQFTRFFAVSALITAGIGAIVSVTGQLIKANIEAEGTSRRVEEAIRRYGDRSGVTAEQIDEIANSISRLTGLDDELIADATVIGLKFNRIGSDIFPRFAKVATDVGVSLGDINAGFERAGKIVNQPIKGLALLERGGYAVAKSQSDLIKSLVAAGEIEAAQVEMLKILEGQYAGTAEAARDTLGGALTALQTSWENMLEKMGEGSITPFREAVESMIGLMELLTDTVLDDSNLIIQAWAGVAVQVNLAIVAILRSLAELIDTLGRAIVFLGLAGLALKAIGSDRLRAGAFAAEANILKFTTQLLSQQTVARKKGAGAALEQTEAESKLNRELERTRQVTQQVYENIGKLLDQALEQVALYKAAIQGQKAYNEELLRQKISHAIMAEENRLRAIGKKLTEEQRKQIEVAIRATETFKNKTDLLVQSWARLNSLSDIKIEAPDFAKIPFIEQAVMEIGVVLNPKVNEEFETQWLDFTEAVGDGLKSDIDVLKDYELQLKIARDLGYGNAIMWEEELARVRQEKMTILLNDWVSFANTLGSLFGGLFEKIANALNSIQAAYNAGNQFGGMLQKYAGAGSWASNLGMYAAAFAAFYEVTKALDAHELRQRGRRYTSGFTAQSSMEGGLLTFGGGGAGEGLAKQLEATFDSILEAIGGFVTALPEIEIQIRNDGKRFRAIVAGIYLGTFKSAEEALGAAIQQALSQASFLGVGPEILHILELAGQTLNMTFEELLHNLDIAKQTERIRLGDVGSGFVDMVNDFLRLIDAQKRLGLAVEDTISALNRSIQAEKNRVLGIDTSTSDQLAALKSLNDGMAQASSAAQAAVQREIDATLARIAEIERAMASGVTGGVGSGSGGAGGGEGGRPEGYTKDIRSQWEEELADLRRVLAQYTDELDKIPQALSDVEINMGIFDALYKYLENDKKYAAEAVKYAKIKVEIEFALIKQQLILLGKWEEFQQMFNDAFAAAQQAAGRTGRGGGRGGGERESARDFIQDRRFELSLIGLTDYQRALAELDKQYDDLIAQAGKDNKLKADLLALKKEEEAILAREERQRVNTLFEDFVSPVSDFGAIRKTAQGLIADIEASPFGDARKARMIGKVMAEVDKQIDKLSREMAAGLFRDMLSDLEAAGVAEKDLLSFRQNLAIIEHILNVENYRTRIALLKAEGKIAPEIMAQLEKAFGMIEKINPLSLLGGGGGDGEDEGKLTHDDWLSGRLYWSDGRWRRRVIDPMGDTSSAMEDARNLLKKYKDSGKDSLTSRLQEINEDFIKITSALGNTADIIAEKNEAIRDAYDDAFSGIRDFYEDLLVGSTSHLSTQEQYTAALSRYNSLVSRLQAGDLSAIENLENILPDLEGLAEKMFGTSTGGFADFRSAVLSDLQGVFASLGIGDGLANLASLGSLSSVLESANLTNPVSAQQPSIDAINDSSSSIVQSIENSGNRRDVLLRSVVSELTMLRQQMDNVIITAPSSSGWGYGN